MSRKEGIDDGYAATCNYQVYLQYGREDDLCPGIANIARDVVSA